LAKEPGVVGNFLRGAENWAPKVAEKVEKMPGGPLKGFRNLILDYLKLFERAGAKSAKIAAEAGKLAKDVVVTPAKQIENIRALQDIMKTEKVFDAAALSKKGMMSKIFTGGVPRLFGNRRMRILMRNTKFWLGFLDWVGVANFVGPDEVAKKLGSEEEMMKKMDEYMKTQQAQKYAEEDFGGQTTTQTDTDTTPKVDTNSDDFIKNILSSIFGAQMRNAAIAAL